MDAQTKNLIKFFLVPLLFATIAVWAAGWQRQPDFLLHVNFYDVGQGDSIFIQTFQGNQILIDGGPTDQVLQYLGEDMPFYDRTIDLLVLTHPHADHVAGFVDILRRYKVTKIILPEVDFHSQTYDEFLAEANDKGVELVYAKQGQRIYLDKATVFDVYYPYGQAAGGSFTEGFVSQASQDLNDTSIVGKLSFGKTSILFTGDAGINIESILLPQFNLDADLLKVGHHGSRHSTSVPFLEEVTPEFAVIEVGENNYGHPTQEVLDKLEQVGSQVFRTDQGQTIRFVSDGANLYKQ
ncbi:MAG: MBL fold metallo-hydrolase [Candidatus Doudnabacteria bacterium]|nr:MBL fold metallo-hydrolase [Candidatus Doudnabacteria bacterium]